MDYPKVPLNELEIGRYYRVRFYEEVKPWSRKGSKPGKRVLLGVYRGLSPDGERYTFLASATATRGFERERIITIEDIESWRRPGTTRVE